MILAVLPHSAAGPTGLPGITWEHAACNYGCVVNVDKDQAMLAAKNEQHGLVWLHDLMKQRAFDTVKRTPASAYAHLSP